MSDNTKSNATLTIGIDLGDRKSHICVLNAAGESLEESQIATKPAAGHYHHDRPHQALDEDSPPPIRPVLGGLHPQSWRLV